MLCNVGVSSPGRLRRLGAGLRVGQHGVRGDRHLARYAVPRRYQRLYRPSRMTDARGQRALRARASACRRLELLDVVDPPSAKSSYFLSAGSASTKHASSRRPVSSHAFVRAAFPASMLRYPAEGTHASERGACRGVSGHRSMGSTRFCLPTSTRGPCTLYRASCPVGGSTRAMSPKDAHHRGT